MAIDNKNLSSFIIIFSFIANGILVNSASTYSNRQSNVRELTFFKEINRFGAEFYESLSKTERSNFITSPISVSLLAAMIAVGARGNTETQLENALHLQLQPSVATNFSKFLDDINNVENIELHLTNGVFISNEFDIFTQFQDVSQKMFKANVEKINFESAEGTASKINSWVGNQTNNKITNVINPNVVRDSKLIMVNAIYFKGDWVNQFTRQLLPVKFHISKNYFEIIEMMFREAEYNYGSIIDHDATYIELPYNTKNSENKFSMYIILPNEIDGLDAISNEIHKIDFTKLNNNKRLTELYLPEFKIESEFNLIPTLKNLGIHDMFNNNADFSFLNSVGKLRVNNMIQKAFINVNEAGTEAGAATVVTFANRFFSDPDIFKVDKPFIAAIVSKTTGTPLFLARVNNPRS